MRYLYAAALILFTGFYTFSHGSNKEGGGAYETPGDDDDDDDDGGGSEKNNYLEVGVNSSMNFTVSDPSHFENTQTIVNALNLKFNTQKSNCSVYAKVSAYTTPSGADRTTIPIELQHRLNDSKNVTNLVTDPIQLTYADQRLFVQPKKNSDFNFYYDLRLKPLGYNYPEGQYNFTLLFTMTQP